ncbi:MAG: IS110 family transposase [Patescibacteria group bacterium]
MVESQVQQNGAFIPRHFDIFAGLDVDKTSMAVNILSHEKAIKSMHIPNNADNLIGYVRKNFSDKKVAFVYEAGPTGWGLHDQLVKHGYPCLVVAPSMVPTAPGARVKTNRLDAKKLAESLRGGQLESIHIPSPIYRSLRHLVQLRDTAVRQVAATKQRIKSLLLFEGIAFPAQASQSSQWSSRVIAELKTIPCSPTVRFKLDQLIAGLSFAQRQVLSAMKEIRRFSNAEPELKRNIEFLTSIPGLGWITSSHMLARIGDWRELCHVRQLACFLGLTQREDSTGESVNKGRITRYGDGRLRSKLIQAAWAAIRKDPELQEFYNRIYQRHPKDMAAKKAIVAVARKMTTRIYAVLRQQKKYDIRHIISSDSLTQAETLCPRGRLDLSQKQEKLDSPDVSAFKTETPGQLIPGNQGRLAQQQSTPGSLTLEGMHLKTVRSAKPDATNSRQSVLRLENGRKDETNQEGKERKISQGAEKKAAPDSKRPQDNGHLRMDPSPAPGAASPARGEAKRESARGTAIREKLKRFIGSAT